MGHFHLQGFTPRKSAATQHMGDAIYPFIVEVSIADVKDSFLSSEVMGLEIV